MMVVMKVVMTGIQLVARLVQKMAVLMVGKLVE